MARKGWLNFNVDVRTMIDNFADFSKGVQALDKNQVLVGIPAEKAARSSEEATGPINNAALGYIHDNGSPAANIPARPFLDPGIKTKQEQISGFMGAAGKAALEGKPQLVFKNLTAAGLVAQAGVRMKINTGPFKPLAPATIAARQRRGRRGTRPLIDTAQLRNAISFIVRKK